jgi:hypothetical protein
MEAWPRCPAEFALKRLFGIEQFMVAGRDGCPSATRRARRRVFSISRLIASVPPLLTPRVAKYARAWRSPGAQGAAESGYLGDRAGREGADDLFGDAASLGGVGGVVGVAQLLVALPGGGEFPVRVTGLQSGVEAGALPLGEVFGAVPGQPADLVERVVLVPAVAEGVLLNAASDLVDDLGSEAHGVEGVEDGDRVGQFVADHVRIYPERVERGVFDAVPDRLMLACQPGRIRGAGSAGDDIEQPCPEPACSSRVRSSIAVRARSAECRPGRQTCSSRRVCARR